MTRRILPIFSIFIVLIIFLAACGEATGEPEATRDPNAVLIYRLRRDYVSMEEIIAPEELTLPEGEDAVRFALACVVGESLSADLVSAFPEDFAIHSFTVSEGEAFVYFGRAYHDLAGVKRTVADACLTLTLCSLEGIESVSVYVDAQAVSVGLTPEDVMLRDSELNPAERQFKLYFPVTGGSFLGWEYRTLAVDTDMPLDSCVVRELLRGPASPRLEGVFQGDTDSALRDVTTEGTVCTVSLSREFYGSLPDTLLGARLALYSIVNSLTSLSEIESVRFLIDDAQLVSYTDIPFPLSEPLPRNEAIIEPRAITHGMFEARLFVSAGPSRLAAIARVVSLAEGASREQAAVAALISDAGEPGFPGLFSSEDEGITVAAANGNVVVTLPDAFFTSRNPLSRALSLRAIALTILDLDSSRRVVFETAYSDPATPMPPLEYTMLDPGMTSYIQ